MTGPPRTTGRASGGTPRPPGVAWARAACLAVAAVFAVFLGVTVASEVWGAGPLGVYPGFVDGALLVRGVEPGSPAAAAGLRTGDELLTVGGRPASDFARWTAVRANLEPGARLEVAGRRDGAPFVAVVAMPAAAWQRWRAREETRLVARAGQLLTLAIAGFVAWRRPRDVRALLAAWLLAALAGASVVPPNSFAVFWRRLPPGLAEAMWLPYLSGVLLTTLLVTLFCSVPRRLLAHRPRARRLLLAAIWLPSLLGLPWVVVFTQRMLDGGTPPAASGAHLVVGVGKTVLYVGAALAALGWSWLRAPDATERRRARVLAAGVACGVLPALPAFATLYWPGGGRWTPLLLSPPALVLVHVAALAMPLSFAYAVLRHRLFDISVIVRRGLQHALARRTVAALPVAVLGLLLLDLLLHGQQPLLRVLGERGWLYGSLLLLALLARRYRERWLTALDRRFFREPYDARRLLLRLLDGLRDATSLEGAAPRVVAVVEAALHPSFVALLGAAPASGGFAVLAAAPAGLALPPLPAGGRLEQLLRVRHQPLDARATTSGAVLPGVGPREREFLAAGDVDLLVPVAATRPGLRAVLALGPKRSEEPYGRDDRELLQAVAAGLGLLLDRPAGLAERTAGFQLCPRCGACWEAEEARCPDDGCALETRRFPRRLAGRYRLDRRLGAGGFGEVFRAFDTALERPVAVKLLAEPLADDSVTAERFRREARIAAGLSHPHLVAVFDFGLAAPRRAFLVLELLDGLSLREALERHGALPLADVQRLARQLAAAVAALHQRGLVHCDVKPENVFLAKGEEGVVAKVLDFGISRRLQPAGPVDASEARLGTFFYTAPERLRGGAVAASWDLWALAVLLYECLAGAPPYPQDSRSSWREAVLAGQARPLGDPALDALFRAALSPRVEERPPSATALVAQLERALAGRQARAAS